MNGPRVFIPQHPTTFDRETGRPVNVGDLSGVMKFGHPVFMLPPGRLKEKWLDRHTRMMQAAMFDFNSRDFLMLTGDLPIQSAAAVIAARKVHGPIQVLRWVRQTNEVRVFTLDTGAR